jgi:5-methylcytosine-specific restriction endonuclease McrA
MKRTPLRRRTPFRRTGSLRVNSPLRRHTPLARSPSLVASDAQRQKVTGQPCVVCGATTGIDPAHVIPRSLGGCDHADCVVALCRPHHRAYDRGRLDLVPYLEPRFRREAAHAVTHVGLAGAVRRISGRRQEPA